MSYNFDIYKKECGSYLGCAEAFDPKTATQRAILKSPLRTNYTNGFGESGKIIKVDENTFEISVAGKEYLARKSVGFLPSQE